MILITERTQPESEIVGSLSDVGLVNLRIAADREERGLWNEFISRYHYLGYKQPFGYPLRLSGYPHKAGHFRYCRTSPSFYSFDEGSQF